MNFTQDVDSGRSFLSTVPDNKPVPGTLFILFCFVCALTFGAVQTCLAETYSWTDSTGNTVYGTKPPKAARSVKKFKTKNLSRYSSTKVLKRLGWRASLKTPEAVESSPPLVSSEEVEPREVKQDSTSPANLEHGPITLKFADTGLSTDVSASITKCEVTVHNLGASLAREVNVAFEFEDGTLIPASGPGKIAAGKTEVFFVPEGLLPLEIMLPEAMKPEEAENHKAAMPKVFLHGLSS